MSDHNRLIARTAREHLTPGGFFQAGSSRTWLQDNGWFMVKAEFRPSGFSKCSMLSMGLHFLWAHGPEAESEDVSAFHYPLYSPSVNQCHAPYTGDDTLFCAHIARFCRVILSETELLRHFRDFSYAGSRLAEHASASIWDAYDHAMLCFLAGRHEDGVASLAHCRTLLQHGISTQQQAGLLDENGWLLRTERWIADEVQPATGSREAAHAFVLASVNLRRAALMARSRYRRMSHDAFSCELR